MAEETGLELYARTARRSAGLVIRDYSTSFGMASRLLTSEVRWQIGAIYGVVRLADEVVDGPAEAAGVPVDERRAMLDALEQEVETALERRFSTNLLVHAFQDAASVAAFGPELTRPFFASMRRDLDPVDLTDEAELDEYVYGSAEVVGLMCLAAFLADTPAPNHVRERLDAGARALGSAFQRVNFVRDLAADADGLGRRYLPQLDPAHPTEEAKHAVLDRIDADLATAEATLPLLPRDARRAVGAAHGLFAALSRRLRQTPADRLRRGPDPRAPAGARSGCAVPESAGNHHRHRVPLVPPCR